MAITGVNSYNSVYENIYSASRKEAERKEETNKTATTQKSTETEKRSSNEEYLNALQKQVPYMKLQIGYGLNTNNDGNVNVLDVSPKLLEKMQNDPKAAKEYTQRLKDIEAATKWLDNYKKSIGHTVIVRHGYVDENGNFSNFSISIRKDELNEKLRKEAQENAEKQIEKTRENARKKAEQLSEEMAEKAEKEQGKTSIIVVKSDTNQDKAKELLSEKLEKSKDGRILLDNDDMQKVICRHFVGIFRSVTKSNAKNSRNRFPDSAASSFRTLPAARFLGWLYGSSRLRLIFSKLSHEMTPSPRTSNGSLTGTVSGTFRKVRTVCVTSSPMIPSRPRVILAKICYS